MPDYKTGSYILVAKKQWLCELCKKDIWKNTKQFVRIEEIGEKIVKSDGTSYKNKKYQRYHLGCARKLEGLNSFELSLLMENSISDDKFNEIMKKQGYKVVYSDTDTMVLKKIK